MTMAKEKNDPEAEKYLIILHQCRSMVGNKALQSVLVKLVSSVKAGSRRCKSHREGNEGGKPAEIWTRVWKGAHLSLSERRKGEEVFQREMLLMWKIWPYG